MRLWTRIHSWLRAMLGRTRMENEMDAELRFHIEAYTEDLMRGGMAREEAMRRARLEFGGIERAKEECREARGLSFFETFSQDLRYGARSLRKSRGFTAVAVITLALGIGANTAIFSLVNAVLLVPLPYGKPEQLVSITGTYPKGAFVAMRNELRTMDVAAYFEGHEFNLTGRGEPVHLTATLVSAELFSVLGARAELGRTFDRGEDLPARNGYVILSHAFWQERFAGDATIIGHAVELEGVSREVVGVMPADFRFPSTKTQVWVPLDNDPRNTVA